jgi:large subunit ribosomal protein L6
MSRIGKKPVQIPAGITATVEGQKVTAKGPKGELFFVANDEVGVKLEDNAVVVTPLTQSKDARSKWGMSRTMIENIFTGVKDGYERKLEINGVGYRAYASGQEPAAGTRFQPRRCLPDPGRHHDRRSEAD